MNIYKIHKTLNDKYKDKITYKRQCGNPIFFPYSKVFSRPLMIFCETVNTCNNECCICSYNKYESDYRKHEVMPLLLFEKVISEYSDIGGGKLSLTPHPGELFLDKLILNRLELIKKYSKITGISITTNGFLPGWYSENELKYIINSFERIMVSIYGIEEEEHKILTNKDTYNETVNNIKRIIALLEDKSKIMFGFRFLKKYDEETVSNWVFKNFSYHIPFGYTNEYVKWSKAINTDIKLPLDAIWTKKGNNSTQCLRPLVAYLIYANGDVIFCPCADTYQNDELLIGNIKKNSIEEIFNSKKVIKLWNADECMPQFCKDCSIHIPLAQLGSYENALENPIDFIGG